MASGILNSFVAAIQASVSVLLVIGYGAIAARLKLLDNKNAKVISKISVKMFLPALLLVKIGSELHPGSAHRYGIILLWAFVAHIISFIIGITAHLVFGCPDWITPALMFNNTTSYPLLLVQSLAETGILKQLVITDGETAAQAVERAKSYFLVFSTVSSCLTFAVGPRLMDSEVPLEPDSGTSAEGSLYDSSTAAESSPEDEQTSLLRPNHRGRRESVLTSITFFPSKPKFTAVPRRPRYIPRVRWRDLSDRTQWWLLFFYDFLNAPLIGAVLGALVGLIPVLHRAFFNDTYEGGIFTAWLTESWKSLAQLFVPLPLLTAGVSLYLSYRDWKTSESGSSGIPWGTTTLTLAVRFIAWPIMSISLIYGLAKAGWLGEDPMLWFALMLMPTGPPALKLITMVQVSDASDEDERTIAKILTISYIISPILAFTVVGSLRASAAAIQV